MRINQVVAGAAVAALAIAMPAAAGASSSHAKSEFLKQVIKHAPDLRDVGNKTLVNFGQSICHALSSNLSVSTVANAMIEDDNNSGNNISDHDLGTVFGGAVRYLCHSYYAETMAYLNSGN